MKICPKRLIVVTHAGAITLLLAAFSPIYPRLRPAQADPLDLVVPELEYLVASKAQPLAQYRHHLSIAHGSDACGQA